MKLPQFADTRTHYRSKTWGNTTSIAYYNSDIGRWYYKNDVKERGEGSPLSDENKELINWFIINRDPNEIQEGDTVVISYISTHDYFHDRRSEFLHNKFYVKEIVKVKHPEMRGYKGESPWYRAVLQTVTGHLEQHSFQYVQLKMNKQSPRRTEPGQPQNTVTPVHVVMDDVSAMNRRIQQIQEEKTGPVSITTAKKGDIVEFIGSTKNQSPTSGFSLNSKYVCRRDYDPNGYSTSRTPEGKEINGTISIVSDENNRENGWAAAFFRIERRA